MAHMLFEIAQVAEPYQYLSDEIDFCDLWITADTERVGFQQRAEPFGNHGQRKT